MKKFKFKIRGHEFQTEVLEFNGNIGTIRVNGTEYEVEIASEMKESKTPILSRKPNITKPEEGQIKKVESTNAVKVNSPLPGTIFKINVKEGDTIKEGDVILVMEAMKMENNVIAEKGGTIKSIKVNVGDAVLQGDLLVEIA